MPSSQGGYPKTHDFLQPLERVGTRVSAKEEGTRGRVDTTDTSSQLKSPYVHNQNVLPGGIGTYTISHMPYLYHNHLQQVPKTEVSQMFTVSQASCNERNAVEDNSVSNCTSYAANNGFPLWNESVEKKGHTRKRQQNQSFMDMIKSAKGSSQEDDLNEDDEELVSNKGNNTSTSQCQRVDLRVTLDGKGHGNEQKPNTPRSKHSATEQRRRSKINDRFQSLRQLIPNSDQKRDKASFLLEVIEYIHFLQEKVDKHEPPEGTVPVLAEAQAAVMEHPVLGKRNSFFPPDSSQLCPVSSSDVASIECENLREEEEVEELSIHKGTISISSVYSQGLLKTLSETLQTSGVDLSRSKISVQIKLSKQPQEDEEVHRKVRSRSPSGDENHNDDENNNIKQLRKQKKFKKDHIIRNI
ncbi:Myc-type [Hirschfeldia incana]|nr:Myc-type [Hirschfeldia incana]KAJ0238131.1 Myc-type [Hirschfeldia incana]